MIRCIRLWTGTDGNSHFEEGSIALAPGAHGDLLSGTLAVLSASFQETAAGGHLEWHDAPVRQLVITLSGTLDFVTRGGDALKAYPDYHKVVRDEEGVYRVKYEDLKAAGLKARSEQRRVDGSGA